MREVALGVRLAVRARPSRSSLIILGAALATALLLTTVGVYELAMTAVPRLTSDEQRLVLTVVVAVACPIVVLLLTAARLSSTSRDARAAALSRLGVSRPRLRVVAAAENGTLALVGAAIGILLHLGLTSPGVAAIAAKLKWFGGGNPYASPLATGLVVLAFVAAASVVGYLPHRSVRPGGALQTPTARPRWWRVVPLAVGIASLALAVASHGNSHDAATSAELVAFLGGAALSVLGLPLALPIAVRLIGDLVTHASAPSVVIAGRGMQDEPATTTRLVAAVLAAITVVTASLCVLQAFWDLPQVRRPLIADTTGPQFGTILLDSTEPAPTTETIDQLAAVAGVRAVIPLADVLIEDEPGACDQLDQASAVCGSAFVGACADLQALAGDVDGCRDDELLDITTREHAEPSPWDPTAATWIRANAWSGPEPPDPASAAVELPPVSGRVFVPFYAEDPNRSFEYSVFVPAALVERAAPPINRITFVLDGGPAGRDPVIAEARELGLFLEPERLDELRTVEGYESMVWGVGSVMLATGLAGLAIAGADRAVERRHRLPRLWAIGTPLRVIRRSQLLRGLLPLAIGAPIATAVGGLVGAAYLTLGGIAGQFPWGRTVTLLAIALVAGAMTALVTLVGLGSRPSPDLLRRE